LAALTATVDPDGGGDYTSLFDCEATEQQDLTDNGGDTWTCTCEASSNSADTTAGVRFVGWTTSADYDITIQAGSGEEAVKDAWKTDRYRLDGADDDILSLEEDYITLTGLQIGMSSTGDNSFYECIPVSGQTATNNKVVIEKCRISKNSTGNTTRYVGIEFQDADTIADVFNNIVENFERRGLECSGYTTLKIYNNIVYGSTTTDGIYISGGSAGGATVKNNAVFNTNDDIDNRDSATVDYNATDDGDGNNPISPSGGSWTNEFTAPSTGNWTLVASGNCDDGGVGPSTDSTVPTTDMEGDTRSGTTCDVGVDENAAAAPSGQPTFKRFAGTPHTTTYRRW